jgi:hydrogenase maturation protein HypF
VVRLAEDAERRTGVTARARIDVRGSVQGVGFRPFVYRLAGELGLRGWVCNSARGASIEVEGPEPALHELAQRLRGELPGPVAIHSLEWSILDPAGYQGFEIRESAQGGPADALVMPDLATCADCLRELLDPGDRRYRYPFTNCTRCGPRYSIIEALPYDRPNTSMLGFRMCAECSREYERPSDRRFHAQPNACATCGPQLALWDGTGSPLARADAALSAAVEALATGRIVAVKGLGGFHLMVDAANAPAVRELRWRKRREEKPFALLCPGLAAVERLCEVSAAEGRLLTSPEAPIVLLRRRTGQGSGVAREVAPDNPQLGVLLPYTPLHHLIAADFGRPLVATSGNLSEEPICTREREAVSRLRGIADLLLVHDRPIVRHVDDSIARICLGREQVLRRARGYAPLPLPVPRGEQPILALGGHLKSSIALAIDGEAFVSQHLGNLSSEPALGAFRCAIGDLTRLYRAQHPRLAADLHPDYASTRHAATLAPDVVGVQHHHAHVASCMADNELDGEVLGVAWDGTGWGPDGTVWGGEFLHCDMGSYRRVACLRRFRLPGGERAVREPRRSALGALHEVFGAAAFERGDLAPVAAFSKSERRVLLRMLEGRVSAPLTSSAGRLFDAVAALLGLRQRDSFEGQAAMAVEFAAEQASRAAGLDVEVRDCDPARDGVQGVAAPRYVLDWEPLLRGLLAGLAAGECCRALAAGFHEALARGIVAVALRVGLGRVVLSGGCFQNRRLTEATGAALAAAGFRAYWHQRVPPNDGGISLGQVAVLRATARRC